MADGKTLNSPAALAGGAEVMDARDRKRLFTSHGTVLFIDPATGDLRGAIARA
jgi:hypothetical protein